MAIVEFSAKLKPGSAFGFKRPAEDRKSEEPRIARSGSLMMRVLTMSREDRIALLTEKADVPVLVLLAMLTPTELKGVLEAAEQFLKEKITEV
jgi:hypothetical protein